MNLERRFTRCSDTRYVLDVPDLCIVLEADRVQRNRWGALETELTVRCGLSGASTIEGTLWTGVVNLSDRSRQDIPRLLATRAKTKDLDWSLLLDELAMRVRDAERVGQPATPLRDIAKAPPDQMVNVHGLRIPIRHPSIWFGDGGCGKTTLSQWTGGELSRQGYAVAVFDWETAGSDYRVSVERLYGADMPPLIYVHCSRPLVHEIDRLARVVHEHKLDFIINDSIGFGCDGPPESAEVATDYLRALRSLGVGSLSLAHISKSGEAAEHRPFGSTYWHNGARMTWFIKSEHAPGGSGFTLACYNRKNNLGPPLPAVGFDVEFTEDTTRFRRADLATNDALASRLTTYERVIGALKHGPLTVATLAEQLDMKVDSIEKFTKRHVQKGHFVRLEASNGVPTRYGLAELRRVG